MREAADAIFALYFPPPPIATPKKWNNSYHSNLPLHLNLGWPARYEIMMPQYVCWSSAGAYVESDGRARSPVRPEGSAGRLEPANDKPPTYWLSAHGRPSLSSRSTQAATVTSAPRLNPYWPGTASDEKGPLSQSHGALWARAGPGGGGAVTELWWSHLASSAVRRALMKAEGNFGWRCLYVIMSHFQRGRGGSRSLLTSAADVWKWC